MRPAIFPGNVVVEMMKQQKMKMKSVAIKLGMKSLNVHERDYKHL